jgi:hypothetical protein
MDMQSNPRKNSAARRRRDVLLALLWALITLTTLPLVLGSWAFLVALITMPIFVALASYYLDRRKR